METILERVSESNPSVASLLLLISHNRQQSPLRSALLIEKMIRRNPKGGVQSNEDDTCNQSSQNIGSHISRNKSDDGKNAQNPQNNFIIERLVEENERLVAKEVEEQPSDEDEQEDDDRNRVPEQAEEDDDEHGQGVINAEVVDVLADSGHGVVVA